MENKITPHKEQEEFLNNHTARFMFASGGINSGKTTLGFIWLIEEIKKHDGKGDYLVIAPNNNSISVLLQHYRIKKLFTDKLPYSGKWIKTNPRYQLESGGTVYFRSAKTDFTNIKPNAIYLDECGMMHKEHLIKVKKIMGNETRMLIGSSPYISCDWIDEFIEQSKTNSEYFHKSISSVMNPTTNKDFVEEEKRQLESWEFKARYLGEHSHK